MICFVITEMVFSLPSLLVVRRNSLTLLIVLSIFMLFIFVIECGLFECNRNSAGL